MAQDFGMIHELATLEKNIRSETNAARKMVHTALSILDDEGLPKESIRDLLKRAIEHLDNISCG